MTERVDIGADSRLRWTALKARIAPLAFWAAVVAVFALTLLPISTHGVNDKAAHFVAFLALTLLARWVWGNTRDFLLAAIALAMMGGLIELLQALPLVGRDAEFLDFVADAGGVVCALLLIWVLQQLKRKPTLKSRSRLA